MRILIYTDNKLLKWSLHKMLQNYNAEFQYSSNLDDALPLCNTMSFNFIIFDQESGLTQSIISSIREFQPEAYFIILGDNHIHFKDSKSKYISKPFKVKEILYVLKAL